jgi:hypothetical protein
MFELEYERRKKGLCATCGGNITEFKDELSEKEFKITGMCQTCQDDVFECEDEE